MDQRAASKWANICEILLLYATHVLLPTTLLLATAKRSLLRYLSVPISIFILHRAIYLASLLGPGFVWCELARLFLTVACQSANLLLINPKDAHILPSDACKSIFHRFYYSSKFFTHPRGINTPWQINNAPSQPAYYQRRNAENSARKHFMIRQIAIVAWQYLALDMFSSLALKQALEQEKTGSLPQVVQWDLSTEQWIERIISNLVAGFVVSRVLIDFHHRVFSIIAVGTGLESISDWPPLFGRTTDAFSLRGFWSKFWHQLLQQPLKSISQFITQDVLGAKPKSIFQRYTNIFIVFLLSGALHVVLDIVQGIPPEESGALLFFTLAPLGLIVEDGVKACWRSVSGPEETSDAKSHKALPYWQQILGLVWTMAWLGVTSTWYFYPQMLRPQNQNLVPFSLADQFGLSVVVGAVVSGGAALAFFFRIEI